MQDQALPPRKHPLTNRAKDLRREATDAERKLWNSLRGQQMAGLKFRRQQPIGKYIVDFFCASKRLVIEVDGFSHEDRAESDLQRQLFLEAQGLKVMRFLNEDIENNLIEVLETICGVVSTPASPPQPFPQGEGL